MRHRIRRLWWKLKRLGGVDIVVTHAAPEGLGDAEDRAHWGFAALRDLLDKYKPQVLVHGHVHTSYGHQIPREIDYNGSRIINACERYVFEIPDRSYELRHHGEVIYKTRRKREAPLEGMVLR